MNNLIEENINYVYALTNYFKNYSSREDLFQVGCIGLLKAYNNFDSSRNVKFTTYAYPYIIGEMKKLVREDRTVHVNRELLMVNVKILEAYNKLAQINHKAPTPSELANFLEIDEVIVSDAINSMNSVESLDYYNEDDILLYDKVGASYNYDKDIDLNEELDKLTSFEREIINRRYKDDLTQQEVADILGISQVKVSRSETKILTKLKHSLNSI